MKGTTSSWGLHPRTGELYSGMVRIAIIEDDVEISEVIRRHLHAQPAFSCEQAFGSVEAFLRESSADAPPDIILMDIGLPGMSGISGIRMIKEKNPEIDIIMLTVYHDSSKVFESLRAGATGYLLKNTPLPEIREAIESVRAGGSPMSPQIARKVIEHFASHPKRSMSPQLSPREKEIVVGLVDGLSYKMIADRMKISTETVRFYIKSIYRKLHVHSKTEVVARSLRGEI